MITKKPYALQILILTRLLVALKTSVQKEGYALSLPSAAILVQFAMSA
jgi:hypothetical protein